MNVLPATRRGDLRYGKFERHPDDDCSGSDWVCWGHEMQSLDSGPGILPISSNREKE